MLTPGTKIGGFLIGELLGKGAMGEVYRGEQLSLKRPVAIKRIATHLMENEEMVRRFKREAQVLAKLSHPNIVGVIECEEFPDAAGHMHLLLVMELIEGGRSLRSYLGRPLDWRVATAIIRMCAEGLAAAYEQQVVHRDIKPDNVMMTGKGIAKLVDFGLAKAAESTALTMQSAPMGTPLFMSPEACRGEDIGHAGDLYSLGVTWWLMLTGEYPFQASNLHGLLFKHISEPLPPPAGRFDQVPQPIVRLVYQCLEKDPARRPESAVRLVEAIEGLAAQGILIPRDARELVGKSGGGSAATATRSAAGSTSTTPTLVAGTVHPAASAATAAAPVDRTAATIVAGQAGPAAPAPVASAALHPPPAAAPTAARPSAKPWLIIGAAAAVLLAALAGWLLLGRRDTTLAPQAAQPPQGAATPAATVPPPAEGRDSAAAPPAPAEVPPLATAAAAPAQSASSPPPAEIPSGSPATAASFSPSTPAPVPAEAPAAPSSSRPPVEPDPSTLAVATAGGAPAVAAPAPPPPAEPSSPSATSSRPSASASGGDLAAAPTPAAPVTASPPATAPASPAPASEPAATAAPAPDARAPVATEAATTDPAEQSPPAPATERREPPIDWSAFDRALAAKEWDAAKQAAEALPESARGEAQARLTKAANAQLIATMKAARGLFDAGKYDESAALLARDIPAAAHADKQVREAFIRLARSVRDAARETREKP